MGLPRTAPRPITPRSTPDDYRDKAIAEATVKVHVKAILREIRVANRTQAAIWAVYHDCVTGGMNNCSGSHGTNNAEALGHGEIPGA